jgi:hypothetical protein
VLAAAGLAFCFAPSWLWRAYFSYFRHEARLSHMTGALGSSLNWAFSLPLSVSLVPIFVARRRVLRDWVGYNADRLLKQFRMEAAARGVGQYVALPIVVLSENRRRTFDRPNVTDLRTISSETFVGEIAGAGGLGKTTLAFQLGEWAASSAIEDRLFAERALPVLIDEDTEDLLEVLCRKLATITQKDAPPDFVRQLLRQGLLMVVWDRVSERSAETRRFITRRIAALRIRRLVWTSRSTIVVEGLSPLIITPRLIDKRTLLYFIGAVIQKEKDVAQLSEQVELSRRLVALVNLKDAEGTTPLLVHLYVTRAIALLADGRDLDELPPSIPDLYVDYVRRIVSSEASSRASVDEIVANAKDLALQSVGADFVPKEVLLGDAVAVNHAAALGIEALISCGLLLERSTGVGRFVRFQFDPVAECLAALKACELCGSSIENWQALAVTLNAHPTEGGSFRKMVILCCLAYGDKLRWPWREVELSA